MARSRKSALLRVSRVAEILGISRQSVLEMISTGRLRSIQAGPRGLHFVAVDQVERVGSHRFGRAFTIGPADAGGVRLRKPGRPKSGEKT